VKVLMVNDHGSFSGAEAIFNGLAHELQRNQIHVQTLTFDELPIAWQQFHYLKHLSSPQQERYFNDLLCNYDLLHCHNISTIGFAPIIAAQQLEIPIVYTAHDYLFMCPHRTFLNCNDSCFKCNWGKRSTSLQARFLAKIPILWRYGERRIKRTKEKILNLFENTTIVTVSTEMGRIFKTHGLENITILNGIPPRSKNQVIDWYEYVLSLGRLTYEKGVDLLFQVANWIEWPIVAINRIHMDYLDGMAKSKVDYKGFVTRECVDHYLRNTTVLVSCSLWHEPFDLTLLDAMMFGKPVVATNLGGHKDIVNNGVTGFLVEPEAGEIAKMCNFLLNNKEEAIRMGKKGKERFEEYFTIERCASDYLKLYRRLVNA